MFFLYSRCVNIRLVVGINVKLLLNYIKIIGYNKIISVFKFVIWGLSFLLVFFKEIWCLFILICFDIYLC